MAKIWLILIIKAVNKEIKNKKNFARYNNVANILRLFGGWGNFTFITSETKHDY